MLCLRVCFVGANKSKSYYDDNKEEDRLAGFIPVLSDSDPDSEFRRLRDYEILNRLRIS